MPDDRPTAAELVDAVAEFLERDLQPALDAARRDGLTALLGADDDAATTTTRPREVELARRIRDGSLDAERPEVVAYLRATLRRQLDIVHPGYIRDREEEAPDQ